MGQRDGSLVLLVQQDCQCHTAERFVMGSDSTWGIRAIKSDRRNSPVFNQRYLRH